MAQLEKAQQALLSTPSVVPPAVSKLNEPRPEIAAASAHSLFSGCAKATGANTEHAKMAAAAWEENRCMAAPCATKVKRRRGTRSGRGCAGWRITGSRSRLQSIFCA